MSNPDLPKRLHPVHLPNKAYRNRSTILFVTVCTNHRKKILVDAQAAKTIVEAWQQAEKWKVGRYVILPDHIHFFCAPSERPAYSLSRWIKYWKALASKEWPLPDQHPIWQIDYWDRQLRSHENYNAKWEYVRSNPIRHWLVERPEDWPYQGELNEFEWYDP
ncbi:MAG: transposase [Fimbriimonadaceae bacterium]|nr:transposase [Fimbriimonadaceae bacterium]